ncbi:MAG TPA: hypothetical protein VFQ92_18695 [Blastocatellia bacterium]|nr:hypothetical protein [Blastocatellia bacterium]
MRVWMIVLAGFILAAATTVAAHQDESLSFSRPTFESVILKSAPKSPSKIYEDKYYAFHYRRSGPAEPAPGFFVYARKINKWMEIKKLSTENAKLGRLPSGEESALTIGKKPYAELPLKSSKSISYPNKIKFDADTEMYLVIFESWQNKEEHAPRFWIDVEDLEEAFAKAR